MQSAEAMFAAERVSREQQLVMARWQEVCANARSDINVFIELCFRNDQDPKAPPFEQQWFHREWQEMWNARVSVLHGPTGFGKTDQVIARILWELGRNPSLRVAIVRKAETPAKEMLLKVKRQIEENKILRAVFPTLRPGAPWGAEALRLEDAGIDTTTNSVTPFGVDGPLLGKRSDLVILDDVNDLENTMTEESREKVIEWADGIAQSRLTTYGRMIVLANAWHRKDLAHTMAKRPGVLYRKYQAEDPQSGRLLWPAFRGREYLDSLKGTMSPVAYARTMQCEARDEGTRLVPRAVIERARKEGAGLKPVERVERVIGRDGTLRDVTQIHRLSELMATRMQIVIGVDLATGRTAKKRKSDLTCFFVVGIHVGGDRQLLWIESGRWPAPEILARLRDLDRRYEPDRFIVESNAAQIFLVQFANEMPGFDSLIDAWDTTAEKWDESLGIQAIVPEMQAGRWRVPAPLDGQSDAEYVATLSPAAAEAYARIRAWCEHLEDFQLAGHTPDDVMAGYFAQRGVMRLAGGVFQHTKAAEMSPPPAEYLERLAAGNAGTVAALFPPPKPPEDPLAATRRLLGM